MAASKTVLGKTLGGLLSDSLMTEGTEATQTMQSLPLHLIQRGRFQPRLDIDPEALSELADSIRVQGVVQPIVVRPTNDHQYEIIAGERRFRASKLAGLTEIPAVIREMNDETALVCALVENVQRENLNAIEESKALSRLIEEFQLTHQEVSTLVGKSRTAVTNSLRLLALCAEVQEMLLTGQLEAGHAKILVTLDEIFQVKLSREIINKQLSVRQAEQRAREIHLLKKTPEDGTQEIPPEINAFEQQFKSSLGVKKVAIQHRASGKGKLIIYYDSLDKLASIQSKLVSE